MAQIIAGWFSTQQQAEQALNALARTGVAATDCSTFYLSPPGQHGDIPLNDQVHHDEGSKESGTGAAKGAAAGGAVGLAAGALAAAATAPLGPAAVVAGAGIGAYVGSLAGAVNKSREGDANEATSEEPVERPAGAIVAVNIGDPNSENLVIDTLKNEGAQGIERADGQWRDGEWVDFDPQRPPQWIEGSSAPSKVRAPN